MKFRIDPDLYREVTKDREREWQGALLDLNFECDGSPPHVTVHRRADGGAGFSVEDAAGASVLHEVSHARLRSVLRDYRDVIVQMARTAGGAFGMRDLDTLDYAKKLVHDEAGELLKKELRAHLAMDLGMARRLFTLVFLLGTDLPEHLIKNHRRHGGA
ncbi:MAG: UPF0262 family protein [Myxococcales bacterium]|nr:UPF0262 family protein [Myxococcales bacterium]MCB9731436.1 UPF0262 family protein [Deltaproteobacteria bacterium]